MPDSSLRRGVERRRKPDIWVRSLEVLVVFGWLLMLAAVLVLSKAKPQVETFFDRYYDIPLRTSWDVELLGYLQGMMYLGLFLGVAGMLVNWRRGRRAEDEIRVSFLLLVILSAIGLLLPYLQFS